MKFGIDCASSITNPGAVKAGHADFVCRYLSPPGNAKNLSKAEAARIHGGGLDLVVVWEENGDEPLSGVNAGIRDARLARAEADALGLPDTAPIYFALDRDPNSFGAAQWSGVEGYYKGVASVLGHHRTGAYGGYAVIKRLFDKKLIAYGWQTYAWSGGHWEPRAQLRQYLNGQALAGISVDFNHAVTADYGQMHPPKPQPKWRRPKHVHVHWVGKDGKPKSGVFRGPNWWRVRHPRAWWHGEAVLKPLMK